MFHIFPKADSNFFEFFLGVPSESDRLNTLWDSDKDIEIHLLASEKYRDAGSIREYEKDLIVEANLYKRLSKVKSRYQGQVQVENALATIVHLLERKGRMWLK